MLALVVGSTLVDVLAVMALVWLVTRTRRERDATEAAQRAALERLRGDLADLVADAERRGRALEQTLATREDGLRSLLAQLDRSEPPAPPAPPGRDHRLGIDPAEARLLRDLELSLARPRA